jgi:hypothetical protein
VLNANDDYVASVDQDNLQAQPAGEIEIECPRVPDTDELLIDLSIRKNGEVGYQARLAINDPDAYSRACTDAAQQLGVQVAWLEGWLLEHLSYQRGLWLQERQAAEEAVLAPAVDPELDELTDDAPAVPDIADGDAAQASQSVVAQPPARAGATTIANPAQPDDYGFHGSFIDLLTFMATLIRHQWLIKHVLVTNQAAVLGGPKKTLKTNILVDLALSLATGGKFLGHFEVATRKRVVLISGESGKAAIQDVIHRIAAARGICFEQGWLSLGFHLPQLSDKDDLRLLTRGLSQHQAEVVIIDPLYLSLLTGNAEANPGNVYAMGPLLLGAARACLSAGATPIFCHHTTKGSQAVKRKTGQPMDLEDLAYSGVAEVARQWAIVSPREEYNPETGESKLWLRVGGSAGHAGLYAVDVAEGRLNDDFAGRTWNVCVQSSTAAIQAGEQAREAERQATREHQQQTLMTRIEEALRNASLPQTTPDIAELVGLNPPRIRHLMPRLLAELRIVRTDVVKEFGHGRRRYAAWQVTPSLDPPLTDAERQRLIRGTLIDDILAAREASQPSQGAEAGSNAAQAAASAAQPAVDQAQPTESGR